MASLADDLDPFRRVDRRRDRAVGFLLRTHAHRPKRRGIRALGPCEVAEERLHAHGLPAGLERLDAQHVVDAPGGRTRRPAMAERMVKIAENVNKIGYSTPKRKDKKYNNIHPAPQQLTENDEARTKNVHKYTQKKQRELMEIHAKCSHFPQNTSFFKKK